MKVIDHAELAALREMDVRDADPEALVEISEVRIDPALPEEERAAELIRQMKGNPYFFRCGNLIVKCTFQGTAPLQQLLEDCLRAPDDL